MSKEIQVSFSTADRMLSVLKEIEAKDERDGFNNSELNKVRDNFIKWKLIDKKFKLTPNAVHLFTNKLEKVIYELKKKDPEIGRVINKFEPHYKEGYKLFCKYERVYPLTFIFSMADPALAQIMFGENGEWLKGDCEFAEHRIE